MWDVSLNCLRKYMIWECAATHIRLIYLMSTIQNAGTIKLVFLRFIWELNPGPLAQGGSRGFSQDHLEKPSPMRNAQTQFVLWRDVRVPEGNVQSAANQE